MANGRLWTEEEIKKLSQLRQDGVLLKEISKILKRTPPAVRQKAHLLQIAMPKNHKMLLYLSHFRQGKTPKNIALAMDVDILAVYQARHRLRELGYSI